MASRYDHLSGKTSTDPWVRRMLSSAGRKALSPDFLDALRLQTPTCRICSCTLTYELPPTLYGTRSKTPPTYATLDRVNPHAGYQPWNVQVCCFECNSRKGSATVAWVRQLLTYLETYLPK